MNVDLGEHGSHNGGTIETSSEFLSPPMFEGIEVIGQREGGLIESWVPVDLIDNEEVPVKKEWVKSLVKEMDQIAKTDGGSGQLTPILVGLIDGESKLKIIDGFHRSSALQAKGEKRVAATVKHTDWDGLYDVRIFTAKDHAHVRFSRVVQWIEEVWKFSGLSDKLSVQQAVLLSRFDSSGAKLGLNPDEVVLAKNWIKRKEGQWQMAAMTVLGYLKVAENVDPKLVHSTREKDRGDVLEAPTQAILKIFSEELPMQFELQNLVMEAAKANNLKGPQVKALCLGIKLTSNYKEATEFVANIDWETWEPAYGKTKVKALRRAFDPRHKGRAVFGTMESDVDRILERMGLIESRGEEVTPLMRTNLLEAKKEARHLAGILGELSIKLSELASSIDPEQEINLNLQRHKKWGLDFRSYEDEIAPTVLINEKGLFELDETASSILFTVAKREPGQVHSVKQIKEWLEEMGFYDKHVANDRAIRASLSSIDKKFKDLGKQDRVIMRFGGPQKIFFGLID